MLRSCFRLLLPTLFLLFSSCDKAPRNGTLDGQWQLLTIDNKPIKSQQRYWRFQLDLMQLYTPIPDTKRPSDQLNLMLRFQRSAAQLKLHTLYQIKRAEGKDSLISDPSTIPLDAYGIFQLPISFEIIQLNEETMHLKHGEHHLQFRKF